MEELYAKQAQQGQGYLGRLAGGASTGRAVAPALPAMDEADGPRAIRGDAALPRLVNVEQRVEAEANVMRQGFEQLDRRLRKIEETLGL